MFQLPNTTQTRYKFIKLFKVEDKDSIKPIINQIQKRLDNFTEWSTKERTSVEEYFLQFPNQSIYEAGIRLSAKKNGDNLIYYKHELLKKQLMIQGQQENYIGYQYEPSIIYTDPIQIFRSMGFQDATRSHSNVIRYKSLKVGLQILLYNEKQDQSPEEFKKSTIEVIENFSYEPASFQLLWGAIKKLICYDERIMEVQKNEISHELMTVKQRLRIQTTL